MKRDTYCVTGILQRASILDRFNLLWVRFDTTGAQDVAIKADLGLGELTFVLIQAKVVVLGSL